MSYAVQFINCMNEKFQPTCAKIQDEIKDTINVSKTTLIVAVVEMGFRYTKRMR